MVCHGERGFDHTGRSVESFGKWLASSQSKAVGLLQIDRRLLQGRTSLVIAHRLTGKGVFAG